MIRRICALLSALLLMLSTAMGELQWPEASTPAQAALEAYVAQVNAQLTQWGRPAVNSLFECYPTFAALGVTAADMAEAPEGVEIYFTLHETTLNTLQLRASDAESFRWLAAASLMACAPGVTTEESALASADGCLRRVSAAPGNSFEEPVEPLNGTSPRAYYAYYPNQYRDGTDWLQLTLVFPLAGYDSGAVTAAATPAPTSDAAYEGYEYDGGTHLEIFTTATPEPDSAAGEAGF